MDIEKIDTLELVRAIRNNYDKEVLTMKELMDILQDCEFAKWEARLIIRRAFKDRNIGRVSYKQLGKHFISGSALVVLRKQVRKKDTAE